MDFQSVDPLRSKEGVLVGKKTITPRVPAYWRLRIWTRHKHQRKRNQAAIRCDSHILRNLEVLEVGEVGRMIGYDMIG